MTGRRRLVSFGSNISGALPSWTGRPSGFRAATMPSNMSEALPPREAVSLPRRAEGDADDFKRVSCGWGHTLVVTEEGRLFVTGRAIDYRNAFQFGRFGAVRPRLANFWTRYLGAHRSIDFPRLTCVEETGVLSAEAGAALSIIGKTDHRWASFGANQHGQCGVTSSDREVFHPSEIEFVKRSGLTMMTRSNSSQSEEEEEFVYGKTPSAPSPKKTRRDDDGDAEVVKVTCGGNHCAALDSRGTVWTWGKDKFGALGADVMVSDGEIGINRRRGNGDPRLPGWLELPHEHRVRDVACSFGSTALITDDGVVRVWGWMTPDSRRDSTGLPSLLETRFVFSELPSPSRIFGCHAEVFAILDEDASKMALVRASPQVTPSVVGGGGTRRVAEKSPHAVSLPSESGVKSVSLNVKQGVVVFWDGTAWEWEHEAIFRGDCSFRRVFEGWGENDRVIDFSFGWLHAVALIE